MKKFFIYLTLVAVTLSGCSKLELQQASKEAKDGMKIAISFDNLTKDSSGLLTPVDRNGVVWVHRGYIRLIAVAADSEGNPDFSNYVESSCEIESYYGNMIVGMTDRSTADWFAHSPSGKCIFFAAIAKESQNKQYQYNTSIYNPETGTYDNGWGYDYAHVIYTLKDELDNPVSLMPLVYVKPDQRTEIDYYDNYGLIYREVTHVIGACSMDAIVSSDVAGSKNTLTLSGIAPANVLLRFNVKRSDALSDFDLRKIVISMDSGDGEDYHSLYGYAFMDFTNYKSASNPFTLVGRRDLATMTGEDILSTEYPSMKTVDENGVVTWSGYHTIFDDISYYDGINCTYADGEKDYEDRYTIPVTSTPSEQWLLASIIPQSAAIAAGSKLVFKAYDNSDNLVGMATKDFPVSGFIGGNQYEFTLTLGTVTP